jgi:CBS domain-containing protein
MRVKQAMTRDVRSCDRETDLARVGAMMWEGDCGAVPVTDSMRKVVGIITDRDICMALATRSRLASEIRVADVISHRVYTCKPEEDVKDALRTMRERRVRRLPVVDENGMLQGILSLSDLVMAVSDAKLAKAGTLTPRDVVATLQSICGHRVAGRVLGAA